MSKQLLKGNHAIALAAIKAGVDAYFGYPITPQNEVPEYLSKLLPEHGKAFVQAESEIAAINMVYGAAGCGKRAMTSSSSVGIALKQEGISYLCGSELPCLIVSVMRAGPGLGGIQPSQADYYQATRGGGNGDYHVIVFAPESIQEMINLVKEGFDIADIYRNPVMILADGLIGQMMEAVDIDAPYNKRDVPPKDFGTTGLKNHVGRRNNINSLYLDAASLEVHNRDLEAKYQRVKDNETKYEMIQTDDAEIVIVAYGSVARIARSAIESLRKLGIKIGMIRPISLWPFPYKAFDELKPSVKRILVSEMSLGQMLDDVKIGVKGRWPIAFYGRTGGMVPDPEEIHNAVINYERWTVK
ncbi:MAG TPA: 3-methyl-2-oxobutanoate dehydrogenase subunit VorB [Bacilli bacterium]|nr:3-methyl-2-oxobutanoate dehydrogenase subunit VorB [Bacilli bacterium]